MQGKKFARTRKIAIIKAIKKDGLKPGPSCYCEVNNMLRKFLDKLSSQYQYVVIDKEAGMEHLSRRTTNNVDLFCIVAEQTPMNTITAKRVLELSEKLPITVKKRI